MQLLDHDRATAAAERGARQFCALLAQADGPDAPAAASPGSACGRHGCSANPERQHREPVPREVA